MEFRLLPKEPIFPDPNLADAEGLVGLSQDITPERLRAAYQKGIFPWFEQQGFYFWFSPDPRMVLYAKDLKIAKSMRPLLNQKRFTVTFDTCFTEVITNCANTKRGPNNTSWISSNFVKAYSELHNQGIAHSVEVWCGSELVGGLYGVSLGVAFFGESMFSTVPNASKFGFIKLVQWLQKQAINFIDCQVYTAHLASLGAVEIERKVFLEELAITQKAPSVLGKWIYSCD
jgi:leucyl/phenylalanyl-tRNA--protein transferase